MNVHFVWITVDQGGRSFTGTHLAKPHVFSFTGLVYDNKFMFCIMTAVCSIY